MSFVRVGGSIPRSPGEVLRWPFCCEQPADAAVVRHLEFK